MVATMTKADVDKLIRDVIGEELAEFRKQLVEEAGRRWTTGFGPGGPEGALAAEKPPPEKGIRAARFVRALAAANGDQQRAGELCRKWGDEHVAKSLLEGVFEQGGAIIPDEYIAEVIDLLRAVAVVRSLGPQIAPMNSGSLTMPYQTQSSTGYYIGEVQNVTPSSLKFAQLQLSAKKLANLVPISNDFLRDASPNADAIVRDDMVRTMALREDLAFIRDDGTEGKPKGMRYWVDAAHVLTRTKAGASSTLTEVIYDLGRMNNALESANVPRTRMGWIMASRTKWFLMTLLDGNGNKVFWDEMMRGTLLTFPYRVTSQIPTNLGGGSESELYLADFSSLLIAENTRLLVDVFAGGAYYDGAQVVSGISTDQTVMRTIARHDFGARHRGKEIVVLTTLDWGA